MPVPFTTGSKNNTWSKHEEGVTIDYIMMGQAKNAHVELQDVQVADLKIGVGISVSDHNAILATIGIRKKGSFEAFSLAQAP